MIGIKDDTSASTFQLPSATQAILVRDLSITPQAADIVSRDLVRPYLGASEQLQANTRVECTFSVEMAGIGQNSGNNEDADNAPGFGAALEACGFTKESTDDAKCLFTPVSTGFKKISIIYSADGILHKVHSARGSFALSCEVGQIPTIDFTFTGVYNGPVDDDKSGEAVYSATYTQQATPLIFDNSNTTGLKVFGETTLSMSGFSLDIGNEITYRELVGGSKEVLLTNRNITGSMTIETVKLTEGSEPKWDAFAAALADGTLGEISFTHGTAALNKVTVQSGLVTSQTTKDRADLTSVNYSDRDGILMWDIPFTLIPTTSGNDEFSLIFE